MGKNLRGGALTTHLLKEFGHGSMMDGIRRLVDEAHASGRKEGFKEGVAWAVENYRKSQMRALKR